ncbi:MAG: outer membrane lipoprotein chaperone LolA [Magnetococcales bacterium]|nr:outer membrane lipoprotein chaperone LolA [Magnetococcales bacterium]
MDQHSTQQRLQKTMTDTLLHPHTALQRNRLLWLLWLLWALLPTGVWAAQAAGETAQATTMTAPVKRLQAFLKKTKTLEADFVQRIENAESGVPTESSGHIATAKPGRFRWDYRTPAPQTLVSDGQSIWFYEPDLAQVTVGKATRLDNTPAVLLSSDVPLHTLFTWETTEDPQLQLPAVRLFPRTKGTVQEILLVLHPERDELLKLITHDSLGHISHFTFQGMRINRALAAEHFQFKIPPQVDIIEDTVHPSESP